MSKTKIEWTKIDSQRGPTHVAMTDRRLIRAALFFAAIIAALAVGIWIGG